jgi:hypothetical protein
MSWIAALLLAAAVEPQESRTEITPRQDPGDGPFLSLGVEGKLSMISGEVVPSQIDWFFFMPIEIQGTDYEDIFSNGTGICLEATLTWEHPKWHEEVLWQTGVYFRLAYDTFDGDRSSDDFGNFFAPRDWEITTAIVGFRGGIRGRTNGLFGEGRVGLGAVYYGAVQAAFALGGAPAMTGELLAPGIGVASELGLKVGYRSERVEVSLGMNMEVQGGPHRGKDVSTVVKPDAILMLSFTFGIGLRF